MAESTLSPTKADTILDVERYLGVATGTETAWIARIFKAGERKFFSAHDWSFLKVTANLTTQAPYETGTVAIAAGVVTLTGGTFPSWAASGVIEIDSISYAVSTRDGNTQVTLNDTSVAADAGTSYRLIQEAYSLPDDFGELVSPLTFHPGLYQYRHGIRLIDEADLRERRQHCDVTSVPRFCAIRPATYAAATGERFEILFDPLSDLSYQLTYRYRKHPNAWGSGELPHGGMRHGEAIRLAVLSEAEIQRNEAPGVYTQSYLQQLALSIKADMQANSPDTLGLLTDPHEFDPGTGEPSHIVRGSTFPPYTD